MNELNLLRFEVVLHVLLPLNISIENSWLKISTLWACET